MLEYAVSSKYTCKAEEDSPIFQTSSLGVRTAAQGVGDLHSVSSFTQRGLELTFPIS